MSIAEQFPRHFSGQRDKHQEIPELIHPVLLVAITQPVPQAAIHLEVMALLSTANTPNDF